MFRLLKTKSDTSDGKGFTKPSYIQNPDPDIQIQALSVAATACLEITPQPVPTRSKL